MLFGNMRSAPQQIFVFICIAAIGSLLYLSWNSNVHLICSKLGGKEVSHTFDYFRVHPFESSCKYPVLHALMPDIDDRHFTARIRDYDCEVIDDEFAVQDDDGYIWVNTHYAHFGRQAYIKDIWDVRNDTCKASCQSGGLRPKSKSYQSTELVTLQPYKRILINSDVFTVKCWNREGQLKFNRKFMGIRHLDKEWGQIFYVDDSPLTDDYGRSIIERNQSITKRRTVPVVSNSTNVNVTSDIGQSINNFTTSSSTTVRKEKRRLSIHVLGFDSTARNQFVRHMVKSLPFMQTLGFEMFTGYNKVGDNSEPNILSLFAGDYPQAMEYPERENITGDINWNRVMPADKRLDGDEIEFLWKYAKRMYNFTTMFNDDIGSMERGLFHYTPQQFKPGFKYAPADHYFRPYYLRFYQTVKQLHYHYCRDGKPIQHTFMDNWRKFASHYRNTTAFGFSFITSHSHDYPFNLEIMDEKLYTSLLKLKEDGVFENSAMIIFGDHGNRMSDIKYTYTGTLEERMPFFSIALPKWFRKEYPEDYQKFIDNRFKLISNYDLHKTMRDIIDMNFGVTKTINTTTRGISVFNEISTNRSCSDCTIAMNFCTCLIDKSNVTEPLPGKIINRERQIQQSVLVLQEWLRNESFTCFKPETGGAPFNVKILGINPFVRAGIRKLENKIEIDKSISHLHSGEYQTIEFSVRLQTTKESMFTLVTRVDNYIPDDSYRMQFEPMVIHDVGYCKEKYMHRLCDCLQSIDR